MKKYELGIALASVLLVFVAIAQVASGSNHTVNDTINGTGNLTNVTLGNVTGNTTGNLTNLTTNGTNATMNDTVNGTVGTNDTIANMTNQTGNMSGNETNETGEGVLLDGYDIYLKIDNITGGSDDWPFIGWIDIETYNFTMSNPENQGRGIGQGRRVTMSDFDLTKFVDVSTPALFSAVASGQRFRNATIALVREDNRQTFMVYTLSEVLVTSYATHGNEDVGHLPDEAISLDFSRIMVEFLSGGNMTTARAGWDLANNRPIV